MLAQPRKPPRRHKPQMTLDRVLSRSGVMSRSQAVEAINAGRITVDGRLIRDPACWITPSRQIVRLDGKRLRAAAKAYWVLYKPKGYITSHGDTRSRPTIYDLLPQELRREGKWLFPVGRLDLDTSGLLLLTNDAVFAERITHPATKVPKTYQVKISGLPAPADLERLRNGLDIGRGEQTAPAAVVYLGDNGRFCRLEITLREGKNRQVRRMVEAIGFKVLKLVRIRIGKLGLEGLQPGSLRRIQPGDVV